MNNFDPHPVDVRFFPNTPEQVLLIDDEEAFLRLASAMLRRAGYASTCAQDSNTAQELLRTTKYHLIIADIRMPGNTNLELIRSCLKTPKMPRKVRFSWLGKGSC